MSEKTRQQAVERLMRMGQSAEQGDCKRALKDARKLIATPLPGGIHAVAYPVAAICEAQQGRIDQALQDATDGSRIEDSHDSLWHLRLGLAIQYARYDAAVATVEEMAQGRGAALNSMPPRDMWTLHSALEEKDLTSLRKRLLHVLSQPQYTPGDSVYAADGFRREYMRMLADQGDFSAAQPVVLELKSPQAMAAALVDPDLRPLLPRDLDLRAAAEAMLDRHNHRAALHPDLLEVVIDKASVLRMLGRPEEALAVLEKVRSKVESSTDFSDYDEHRNWYWDSLASTYHTLGRYEDLLATYRRGADAGENGGANVSQVINLAGTQLAFAKPDEALRTVSVVVDENRGLSPYGIMQVRKIRGCALARLDRRDEAALDLAYITEHIKDDPRAETYLRLCLGDMDGAARALIAQLDGGTRSARARLLLTLADYDPPPPTLAVDPVEKARATLKQRPDVRAAIDKAGGLPRIPLQDDGI